jgi:hypothetical protein
MKFMRVTKTQNLRTNKERKNKMYFKIFTCVNFDLSAIIPCPYKVTGEEEWVIEKAMYHLMIKHGNEDTPLLKEDIKASLKDAVFPVDPPPSGTV